MALLLVPVVAQFTGAGHCFSDNWQRMLPLHLLAAWHGRCCVVVGMVAIRKAGPMPAGACTTSSGRGGGNSATSTSGHARSYAGAVLTIEGYRFGILRRLQGEASLLDAPDDGAPLEPVQVTGTVLWYASPTANSRSPQATSDSCRPPAIT
ncbi:MAG: hypothetical protein IPH14_05225 [Thermomonas sp.]|uniref:hypothetical protein n=1 Tax=Thermomonas sp. TaxID=1971895 RepID=UPI0025D2141C|nr:hypothetical protein [Thermomonas sp.]MBK6924669.1 hypothetical protein [Thermomonas sp.]